MAKDPNITADEMRKLLSYNSDTGVLTWLARTPSMFKEGAYSAERACAAWNARFANRMAGWTDPDGYLIIGLFDRLIRGHRVAFLIENGRWPKEDIDHRDVLPSNNSSENIREASRSQNITNTRLRADNTSGYKGVSFNKSRRKWVVRIYVQKKEIQLGYFDTFEAAVEKRIEAAKKYYGEFARTA